MPARTRPAILIVDDDPAFLDLLSLSLEEAFAVTIAPNGARGLAAFDGGVFDVVITDRVMPEMAGAVFAAKIKEREARMPIILISGHCDAEVDRTLFRAFLRKPFTRTQLFETLEDVLPDE